MVALSPARHARVGFDFHESSVTEHLGAYIGDFDLLAHWYGYNIGQRWSGKHGDTSPQKVVFIHG